MNKLLKADILSGRFARVKDVYVEAWDGSIAIWSLTDGQLAHVESLRVRGLDLSMDADAGAQMPGSTAEERRAALMNGTSGMRIDVEALTLSDAVADSQAVAYALSGGTEQWTLEDVQAMRPASVVKMLVTEVYALSGVDKGTANAVAEFRADRDGDGDVLPEFHRLPASDDASGAYAAATSILDRSNAVVPTADEPATDL